MSKEHFEIYWRTSKLDLAEFLRGLYQKLGSENRGFYQETRGSSPIEGFIYDIGHYGRGLDDFPETIGLETPETREVETPSPNKPLLEVEMPVSDLVEQIKEQIRPYLEQHPYKKNNPQAFIAELETLEAIARRTSGRMVRVKLSLDYQNRYKIKSVELVEGEE